MYGIGTTKVSLNSLAIIVCRYNQRISNKRTIIYVINILGASLLLILYS